MDPFRKHSRSSSPHLEKRDIYLAINPNRKGWRGRGIYCNWKYSFILRISDGGLYLAPHPVLNYKGSRKKVYPLFVRPLMPLAPPPSSLLVIGFSLAFTASKYFFRPLSGRTTSVDIFVPKGNSVGPVFQGMVLKSPQDLSDL